MTVQMIDGPASRNARKRASSATKFLVVCLSAGMLIGCAQNNARDELAQNGPGAETLAEKVDRLERDLANLRIDYSVVRPAMERIVAAETGIEARINAIESAFGPITASISPQSQATPAYVAPPTAAFPKVGIHLASYRDTENVERGWRELQAAQADILSDLNLNIVDYRSDHDGFYRRLVAGPIDPASAESRCASLKDRGVWCQVVTLER